MIALVAAMLCAAVATTACALLLTRRLAALEAEAATLAAEAPELQAVLMGHVDETLAGDADQRGWASLRVAATERHDPYRDAASLVRFLAEPLPGEVRGLEARVKATYQLAATLDLDDADVERLLAEPLGLLAQQRFLDNPVAEVERVRAGDLVDRKTMWPLTTGARVRQPLGVVLRDADGNVLSRAKVLC